MARHKESFTCLLCEKKGERYVDYTDENSFYDPHNELNLQSMVNQNKYDDNPLCLSVQFETTIKIRSETNALICKKCLEKALMESLTRTIYSLFVDGREKE